MEKIRLGASPVEITPLGVGCWAWGDRVVWGYGRDFGEAEVGDAFEASRAAGLDFFDTAEIYGFGVSETILGKLAGRSPGVVIASKFFPYPWRLRRGALVRALRASLDRLGVEKIDLYQIHWPSRLRPDRIWLEAMADAFDEGWIRAVGVSNFSTAQMEQAHALLERRGIPLASNQVRFSLIERRPERSGLLERCRQLGVSLIAYSPIGMGLLTGKYMPGSPPPLARRRGLGGNLAKLTPLIEALGRIGEAHGDKTPAQVALRWTMDKGAVPIPGAKNRRQAGENSGALGWRLSPAAMTELDSLSERLAA